MSLYLRVGGHFSVDDDISSAELVREYAYLLQPVDRKGLAEAKRRHPFWWRDDQVAEQLAIELSELCQVHSPPFTHFGSDTTHGPGTVGCWFSWDAFRWGVDQGDVVHADGDSDGVARANPDCEYVAEVNDHGNLTLWCAEDLRADPDAQPLYAIV
jgi:hypothetical protein